jgi:hypothetical protein
MCGASPYSLRPHAQTYLKGQYIRFTNDWVVNQRVSNDPLSSSQPVHNTSEKPKPTPALPIILVQLLTNGMDSLLPSP